MNPDGVRLAFIFTWAKFKKILSKNLSMLTSNDYIQLVSNPIFVKFLSILVIIIWEH